MFKYNPYVFIHQYTHKDRVFEIDPTILLQFGRTEDSEAEEVAEASGNEIGVVPFESILEENEARILFDERSKMLRGLDQVNEDELPKQLTEGVTLAELYDMTKEEVSDIIRTGKLSQIRYFRDKELLATDWTALADVPTKIQELFRPYRQYLRDLPNQEDLDNLIVLDAPTK